MRLFVSWITDYNRFPTHCQGFISIWEGCKSQTIFFTCKTRGSSERREGEKNLKVANISFKWLLLKVAAAYLIFVMFKRMEICRRSFLWGSPHSSGWESRAGKKQRASFPSPFAQRKPGPRIRPRILCDAKSAIRRKTDFASFKYIQDFSKWLQLVLLLPKK